MSVSVQSNGHKMNDQSESKKSKTAPLDVSKILPFLNNNETAIVPNGINRVRRMADEASDAADDSVVHHVPSVAIVVRGIREPLGLSDAQTELVLGRVDLSSATRPDIDLSHLGAAERGVSRRHARLEIKENHLYITDLNSSNGTHLKGSRLNPYTPALVHRHDEVLLGRLALEIVFD